MWHITEQNKMWWIEVARLQNVKPRYTFPTTKRMPFSFYVHIKSVHDSCCTVPTYIHTPGKLCPHILRCFIKYKYKVARTHNYNRFVGIGIVIYFYKQNGKQKQFLNLCLFKKKIRQKSERQKLKSLLRSFNWNN